MNRKLFVVVLFAALSLLAACRDDKPKTGTVAPPTGPAKRPVGVKALPAQPGPTPFTQADVATYFQTHNLARNSTPASSIHVDRLEFIQSSDVTRRLDGERTGLEDTANIGFATLSGDFLFTGPSGTHPARFTSAYAAFDATTGNLLMFGTLASSDNSQRNGDAATPKKH